MTDKPKRRWLQFRLRTLLLIVAVLCVPLAWVGVRLNQKRRERAAVAAIRDLNGYISYDWWDNAGKSTPPGPQWLRAIFGDDFFADVASIEIYNYRDLVDGDLVHLKVFKRLRTLSISGGSSKLVTDAGVAFLTGMKDIERLLLCNMQLTDAGLSSIIKGMDRLTTLELDGTDITDGGLAIVSHLPALETLSVEGCGVTDTGLAHLSSLPALRRLDLSSTLITDAALVQLAELKGLTSLRIAYTDQISFERMVKLRKALPNCKIRDR